MDSDLLEICMSVLLDFLKKDVEKTELTLRDHFVERLGTDSVFDGIIKKCPFCGGDAELTYAQWDYNYWGVSCKACVAYVCDPDTGEKAIKKWNTRIK